MNLLAQATSPAAAETAIPSAETPEKTPAPAEISESADEAAATAVEDVAAKIMEGAGESAPAASADADAAIAVVEVPDTAPGVVENLTNVPPQAVFMMGVALMALFLWFFATENAKRKRLIGTILAIAVTAGSLWFFELLGINKGIELRGGIAMTIRIVPPDGREVSPEAQVQAIKVLERRLNAQGTQELTLAAQGRDRIFLQIPGMGEGNLDRVKKDIQQVAKLDFSIVHPQSHLLAARVATGEHVEPGYRALPNAPELGQEDWTPEQLGYELVKIKPDMAGTHVSAAHHYYGPEGDSISVSFDGKGAQIMGQLTLQHREERLAIIMDDEILSAPVIREPFSSGCSITGNFTRESASALASALENPLENPIEIEHSNYISPTMGKETVRMGINAGVAGLLITLVFIVVYYRFAGLVALTGLGINIAIIFGAMALFKFTLTLPGIAGIILTIGIAIDANVLIYERLREELAVGKSLGAAIQAAYQKAASAILDANITSLFTALILYAVATGTIKGFAVTLTIGILATLFSALLVSRVCFAWLTETGFLQSIKFLNLIPEKTIDFLGKRRPCLVGSAILFLISLTLIFIPTIDPRGVDLKGGDLVTIETTEDLSVEKIEGALHDAGLTMKPIVQSLKPVGAEGEFFTIRSEFESGERVIDAIKRNLNVELDKTTTDSVGSAVGNETLKTSVIALVLGVMAILVYVTLRFEFAFALGAIVALFHDLIITLGIVTIFRQEVSLITVGAFLTIAGYSINDTIVIFDRVREGLRSKRGEIRDVINYSINATLGRTILTSGTTLFTVLVLFLFGGPALRNFSFTLIAGVLVGTYSSIFIASPIVLWWARRSGTNLRREILDAEQGKVGPAAVGG